MIRLLKIPIILILAAALFACDRSRSSKATDSTSIVLYAYRGGNSFFEQVFARGRIYATDYYGNQIAVPSGFKKWRSNMAWSSDGRWLAFDKISSAKNHDIFVTDWPNQDKLIRVTPGSSDDIYPSWSPDNNSIIYEQYYGKINIIDVNCVYQSQVCNTEPIFLTYGKKPIWSPEGKYVVFEGSTNLGEEGRILVLAINGEQIPQLISPKNLDCYLPQWAPDGLKLIFQCSREIYIVNVDGTDLRDLAAGDLAKWSPDGKLIYFRGGKSLDSNLGETVGLTGFDGRYESDALFNMDQKGKNLQRITHYNYESIEQFFFAPLQEH